MFWEFLAGRFHFRALLAACWSFPLPTSLPLLANTPLLANGLGEGAFVCELWAVLKAFDWELSFCVLLAALGSFWLVTLVWEFCQHDANMMQKWYQNVPEMIQNVAKSFQKGWLAWQLPRPTLNGFYFQRDLLSRYYSRQIGRAS